MSHESSPRYEDNILFVPLYQARTLDKLAEVVVEQSTNDQYAWVIDNGGGANIVQRVISKTGEVTVLATHVTSIDRRSSVHSTHYVLNPNTGMLTVTAEVRDIDCHPKLDNKDTPPALDDISSSMDDLLHEMGFNHATPQDWDDFIALVVDASDAQQKSLRNY